jgi:hypothetical protein
MLIKSFSLYQKIKVEELFSYLVIRLLCLPVKGIVPGMYG